MLGESGLSKCQSTPARHTNWGHIGCAGTSYSAPMVSGAAALILSRYPSLIGHPCNLADHIIRNGTAVAGLANVVGPGGKRLDAKGALINPPAPIVPLCP